MSEYDEARQLTYEASKRHRKLLVVLSKLVEFVDQTLDNDDLIERLDEESELYRFDYSSQLLTLKCNLEAFERLADKLFVVTASDR